VTGSLTARVVLVTGAGAGVGRAIARACAAAGAHVVVASPRENGVETVDLIRSEGGAASWACCDVTDGDAVDASVAHAVDVAGGLDVMIHNATSRRSSEPAQLEEVGPEVWHDHVSVSLTGAYHCARAARDHLRARSGSMILMTSPAGMEGSRMLPVYGVVKGALRGFTKSLAREWGPDGVRVNAVSPLARTPAMANAIEEDPALADRLARRVPLGRVGDADTDVAPAVVFLASDAARYVTGQTLVVDGGRFLNL
jgi:3-oxoacyl-[acyl-carrier protein] reductase